MLKLAKDSGLTDIVSSTNPITTQHPITGSVVEVQVYLFNDDSTKRYESVVIDAVDTVSTDESGWVEVSADGVTYSATLNMGNIAETTGHPFWVRVSTPSVGATQNKTDINLQITGTEFAV